MSCEGAEFDDEKGCFSKVLARFVFFFVDVDAVDWQVGCICGGSG